MSELERKKIKKDDIYYSKGLGSNDDKYAKYVMKNLK